MTYETVYHLVDYDTTSDLISDVKDKLYDEIDTGLFNIAVKADFDRKRLEAIQALLESDAYDAEDPGDAMLLLNEITKVIEG